MDMCPRHVGGRYPTPGLWVRAFQPSPRLALHADHLAQRVHYIHQIALRFHHCVDGLVRHRSFIDDAERPAVERFQSTTLPQWQNLRLRRIRADTPQREQKIGPFSLIS